MLTNGASIVFFFAKVKEVLLFSMVRMSADDGLKPVNLFAENGAHQHVRQSQLSERKE